MMMNNPSKRSVSGFLLLNKPQSISSNQALQKVKRLFKAKKAGHTGCLDPLATGMLPICLGEATKFSQYLLDSDKWYQATARLGQKTDTADATGTIVAENDSLDFKEDALHKACLDMLGTREQIPPMYSALKYQGQPLYKLARQGKTVTRNARQINIKHINLISISANEFTFKVCCSKGTYIRTLIEDIAAKINLFAHMTALDRTATCGFESQPMISLPELEHMDLAQRDQCLLPVDTSVRHLPALTLVDDEARRLLMGQQIQASDIKIATIYRVYNQQRFLGLVQAADNSQLAPLRLMVQS